MSKDFYCHNRECYCSLEHPCHGCNYDGSRCPMIEHIRRHDYEAYERFIDYKPTEEQTEFLLNQFHDNYVRKVIRSGKSKEYAEECWEKRIAWERKVNNKYI